MNSARIFLFEDVTAAREVGQMLRANFDGLNAITLIEPIDEIAVETALSLQLAECCEVGTCCYWFAFQLIQIEVELNRLGYQICCNSLEFKESVRTVYMLLRPLEDEANKTKQEAWYFTDTQGLYFFDGICARTIAPNFTKTEVTITEGDWIEAAILPQGLPEGKTVMEGISIEIQKAAQWWTDLLKQEWQNNIDLCPYSLEQFKVFEQALRETITEKIGWAGYDPIAPLKNSFRRRIYSTGPEIEKATTVAGIKYVWFRNVHDICLYVQINPGRVIVSKVFSSDYTIIYEYPSQQKSTGWLQKLINLIW